MLTKSQLKSESNHRANRSLKYTNNVDEPTNNQRHNIVSQSLSRTPIQKQSEPQDIRKEFNIKPLKNKKFNKKYYAFLKGLDKKQSKKKFYLNILKELFVVYVNKANSEDEQEKLSIARMSMHFELFISHLNYPYLEIDELVFNQYLMMKEKNKGLNEPV